MKIATFNIQNLFHRDRNLLQKPSSKNAKDWFDELDSLINIKKTSVNNLQRINELSFLLGFEKTYNTPFAVMRRKAGDLYLKGRGHVNELRASATTHWNGWTVLQNKPLDPEAVKNKARVTAEIDADILLLQEIEDRASLEEFNSSILPTFDCATYEQTLLLQGKDLKGLEMAVLLKNGYRLHSVKSHSFYYDSVKKPLLTQEFFEYRIETPSKETFYVLSIHLKIEDENKETADAIRKEQVGQIAMHYHELLSRGKSKVIIAGTLNTVSYCDSLSPLLRKTDLKDVAKHQSFNVDIDKGRDASYFRMGAYRIGVNIKQKDYLLFSPELFNVIKQTGLNRKAVWPSKKPIWSIYSSMNNKNQEASEHPAIWAEIDV